jgi:hypothetical protein
MIASRVHVTSEGFDTGGRIESDVGNDRGSGVRYNARSLLGQVWALALVAVISAALAAPAHAQGPDPAPTHAKALRPDPAPAARPKASSSTPT